MRAQIRSTWMHLHFLLGCADKDSASEDSRGIRNGIAALREGPETSTASVVACVPLSANMCGASEMNI